MLQSYNTKAENGMNTEGALKRKDKRRKKQLPHWIYGA